jgi:hypothetical protein
MTPKQEERIRTKIKHIKAELSADKKRNGGYYDDSKGFRYLPTSFYIQIGDFSAGLRYTKWFQKNFPDDSGLPDFLFEWTIILFKTNNLKDAEKKAFETFCSNTYLFDKFLGKPIIPINKYENSNIDIPSYCDCLNYTSEKSELADFSDWLIKYLATEKFITLSTKFIDIYKQLKIESNKEKRSYLLRQSRLLEVEV